VTEARTPIFGMCRPTVSPGVSRGTRNGETSFSDVLANTVKKSATGAEVIQVFWPVTTQSSPSRVAFVVMAERSLPAPGSVKQIVPTRSPASAGRRNSSWTVFSPERKRK